MNFVKIYLTNILFTYIQQVLDLNDYLVYEKHHFNQNRVNQVILMNF